MEVKEIVVSFYCIEDNYERIHEISYEPTTTRKEIITDLERTWGNVMIVGFREIVGFCEHNWFFKKIMI